MIQTKHHEIQTKTVSNSCTNSCTKIVEFRFQFHLYFPRDLITNEALVQISLITNEALVQITAWRQERVCLVDDGLVDCCIHVTSGLDWLTVVVLNFSAKTVKYTSIFSTISGHWDVTGSRHLSTWKSSTCLSYIVNTMAVDGVATQGSRTPTAMMLVFFSGIFHFSTIFSQAPYQLSWNDTCQT